MVGGSLGELLVHLKLARQYALDGHYDISFNIFDRAVAQINKHLSSVDDPLIREKWMNVMNALSEESEGVKQLDDPIGRRPSSPPISTKSPFVFQPLDEYPNSSSGPIDDPYVWSPSRDTGSRRPPKGGQVGTWRSQQDGAWARGAKRAGTTGRGAKAGGATSRVNSGARASTHGKKGSASGKSSKTDAVVSFNFYGAFCQTTFSGKLLTEKTENCSRKKKEWIPNWSTT